MNKHTDSGFTLIELMIVIGIVSILGAFSYPAYMDYSRKARRSDAQQVMLDISNKQEQYLLDVRQYTTDPTTLGISKDGWSCTSASCTSNFYTAITTVNNAATPPTYSITATATGNQVPDGDLTLNSVGTKTHNGSTGW